MKNEASFNVLNNIVGTSWFLCVLFLSYLIFPFILHMMEKFHSKSRAIFMICISITIQFFIGIICKNIPNGSNYDSFWNFEFAGWLMYKSPYARIWDIFIGMNLGYLFILKKDDINDKTRSFWELIGIVLSMIACYTKTIMFTISSENLSQNQDWYTYVIIFTPCSILLVYNFAFNCGFFSKVLTNKFTLYLAKISPYGFLIHYLVFRWFDFIFYHIPCINNSFGAYFRQYYGPWIKLIIGFIFTSMLCKLWSSFCVSKR